MSTVTNAITAAGRVVAAVATGQPVSVSPAEHSRRLTLCHVCPSFNHRAAKCRECGCYSHVKAALATEKCPLGKWC